MSMKKGTSFAVVNLILFMCCMTNLAFAGGWQWIAPERVTALLKEGSGLWLVDVRNEAAFAAGHIEGAMLIPADTIAKKQLPKGKIIVLADDSLGLRQGRGAADALLQKGYDKVFLLEGGIPAWLNDGYPMAGKGGGRAFRSVMPVDIDWALENKITLRIFDLREKSEQTQGPVRGAQVVEGKNLTERLARVKESLTNGVRKDMAARLEKTATVILVFPVATDPRMTLERSFRGVSGDVRFVEGGYAAWAAKPDKSLTNVGVCPTCPKGAPGGSK
jgi:phage shock protein E